MLKSRTNWEMVEQPSPQDVLHLSKQIHSSELFASLCLQRNLDTPEKVHFFLNPDDSWYHDPFSLGEMKKAVDRIFHAIETNEKITVYGDYDADGVTSTAILVEAIQQLGGRVEYFIPNRFIHGYGPNIDSFRHLIDSGTSLILTCDNGIAGHEALEYAFERKIDVIVTDHHEVPDHLPRAYALIHPRLPGFSYPFGDLSGAGVAFKVAWALLGKKPEKMLDLAAIGTIADLVSLTDENRVLALQGLEKIKTTSRAGILSLLKKGEITPSSIDEDTIGFSIAPRLNAAGRLEEASTATELLLTNDTTEADNLAEHLILLNDERKLIVERIATEALEESKKEPDTPVHIIAKRGWHEGVLGIVASRVVQETGKPAIILRIDENGEIAKGSGRSIASVDLYEMIRSSSELMTTFGGHQMAAGMSLHVDNLEQFKENVSHYLLENYRSEDLKDNTEIHHMIRSKDITLKVIQEIKKLAPFGNLNEKPVFLLNEVHLSSIRQIGTEGQHVKISFGSTGEKKIDSVGFNMPAVKENTGHFPMVSAIGTIEINEWRGRKNPQFLLKDIRTEGVQYFDKRSKSSTTALLNKSNADYIFFNTDVYHQWQEKLPKKAQVFVEHKRMFPERVSQNKAVLFDCPSSLSVLSEFLAETEYIDIYCHFRSSEQHHFDTLPDRESFVLLYKYLKSHPGIRYKEKLKELGLYLGLEPLKINFMITVFFEAGFVTIEDGAVFPTHDPVKKDLTKMSTYRLQEERIHTHEYLHYSSMDELIHTFEEWDLSMPVV